MLTRDSLLDTAQRGLKKGISEDLLWFPFDQLPAVTWSDTREPVEPDIVSWWLVQGFRKKNPEATLLQEGWPEQIPNSQGEVLGKFVLEQWIQQDIKIIEHPDIAALTEQFTAEFQQFRHFSFLNLTPEAENQRLQDFLTYMIADKTKRGSAIKEKGILSVAGSFGGATLIPLIEKYLDDWQVKRSAQCWALVQMLGTVDDARCIQWLVRTSQAKNRTKSIRQQAQKYLDILAKGKGWSQDDLIDRTIPTFGFDSDGVLKLDFGPRSFSVQIDDSVKLVLKDAEGTVLKALPTPRASDDEKLAKEAKKTFSDLKKQLKELFDFQTNHLWEAMCLRRNWSAEDWTLSFQKHPVMGRLCQHVIWEAATPHSSVCSFRPLADGTLTDADDNPVELPADSRIRVAHALSMTEAERAQWQSHLADYEVETLFPQVAWAPYHLPENLHKIKELADFAGHLIESVVLHGKAAKFGYSRAESDNGLWFWVYQKNLPSLGVKVVIEYTGSGDLKEKRTVALKNFYLTSDLSSYGYEAKKLELGKISPVLLSEIWHEIRQLAAAGTGFNPEWKKICGV
ncbi:MAG: DUF4132 domain-containing protein [Acidobacteria bacterium]|nr:DUF4132 domain-containing protein [Acidobacteriota bacterium]